MILIVYGNTYENWSLKQASQYLRQIEKRIEILSRSPNLGRRQDLISLGLFCSMKDVI